MAVLAWLVFGLALGFVWFVGSVLLPVSGLVVVSFALSSFPLGSVFGLVAGFHDAASFLDAAPLAEPGRWWVLLQG